MVGDLITFKLKMPFILIENTMDLVDYCFVEMFRKIAKFSEQDDETQVVCAVEASEAARYGDISEVLGELDKLLKQALRSIILERLRENLRIAVVVEGSRGDILASTEFAMSLPRTNINVLKRLASFIKMADLSV